MFDDSGLSRKALQWKCKRSFPSIGDVRCVTHCRLPFLQLRIGKAVSYSRVTTSDPGATKGLPFRCTLLNMERTGAAQTEAFRIARPCGSICFDGSWDRFLAAHPSYDSTDVPSTELEGRPLRSAKGTGPESKCGKRRCNERERRQRQSSSENEYAIALIVLSTVTSGKERERRQCREVRETPPGGNSAERERRM